MKFIRPLFAIAAFTAIPLAAAADKTFVGPATWLHVVTGTPGGPRTIDVWKMNSSASAPTLNVTVDTGQTYADAIAAVRANAQNGGIKIKVDKDRPCAGVTAHAFDIELEAGDVTILTTYTIVPDPKGITRIAFSRPSSMGSNKDVQAAVDAFCAP
jgi:hypothetical protein